MVLIAPKKLYTQTFDKTHALPCLALNFLGVLHAKLRYEVDPHMLKVLTPSTFLQAEMHSRHAMLLATEMHHNFIERKQIRCIHGKRRQ